MKVTVELSGIRVNLPCGETVDGSCFEEQEGGMYYDYRCGCGVTHIVSQVPYGNIDLGVTTDWEPASSMEGEGCLGEAVTRMLQRNLGGYVVLTAE